MALLGSPPELLDPKWSRPAAETNPVLLDEFNTIFYEWLFPRTKSEIWAEVMKARLLCAPLNTAADLLADPVLEERGFWADTTHPMIGAVRIPGRPFLLGGSPWQLRRTAPLLGEHTAEVLSEVGYSRAEIVALQ